MKYNFLFLFIMLFSNLGFNQTSSIELRLKHFGHNKAFASSTVPDIGISEEDGNGQNYDLLLRYSRSIKKLNLFVDVGILKSSLESKQNIEFADGTSRRSSFKAGDKGVQLAVGLGKDFSIKKTKFRFNAAMGLKFIYNYDDYNEDEVSVFGTNGYEMGERIYEKHPSSFRYGPNLEFSLIYDVWRNFFVGLNVNTWLSFISVNDEQSIDGYLYNDQREITAESSFSFKHKSFAFEKKRQTYSILIGYKF